MAEQLGYLDQWAFLSAIDPLARAKVDHLIEDASASGKILGVRIPLVDEDEEPWLAPPSRRQMPPAIREPLPSAITVVQADQTYLPRHTLPPSLIARLIRLAAFQNPEFYAAQAMRRSTHDKPRIISCAELTSHHVALPRGCFDAVCSLLASLGIAVTIEDCRTTGAPIPFAFTGALRPSQEPAIAALLLTTASVAIDGSKFKAVNTRDKNLTSGKVERRRAQLEKSVARYLAQLDTAELYEPSEELAAKTAHLKEKLVKLDSEMQRLAAMEKLMLASPDQQISLTDPDSRSMATSGRGSGVVGYNVQVAVDTEHHLIVTHEVTNVGSDRSQLATVAKDAKAALQMEMLEAVADRGSDKSTEIKACDEAGVAVTLPKPMTSGAKSDGRFGKQDFVYNAAEDVYRCPAGEKLAYRMTTEQDGKMMRRYWTNACPNCLLKSKCTTGNERRIPRWEHEHVPLHHGASRCTMEHHDATGVSPRDKRCES